MAMLQIGRHILLPSAILAKVLLAPATSMMFPRVIPFPPIPTMATLLPDLEPLRAILKQIGSSLKIHLHGVLILIRKQFPLQGSPLGAIRELPLLAQKALTAAGAGQAKDTAITPFLGLKTPKVVFVQGTAPLALVLIPMIRTQSLKPWPPTRQWQAALPREIQILKLGTSLWFL